MPNASAPTNRPSKSLSALYATYTTSPFSVTVPPNRMFARSPVPRRGSAGTHPTVTHAPTAAMEAGPTAVATKAQ